MSVTSKIPRMQGGNFAFCNNNLLLTEREGRTGEYRPEVVAVRTERSEVRTKTTKGQYRPISEVTSHHVISRSGGQASKQIVCVRGPS